MNKTYISKEILILTAKEIVAQSSIQALNMREVAQRCGIAVGSIYNYFPSKEDFIIATIESIWQEIMHDLTNCSLSLNFAENVFLLFNNIHKGCQKYPSFFQLHSMSLNNLDKNKGRQAMQQYFNTIKALLLKNLEKDPDVRENVFCNEFTKPDFVDFIFSNILTLLMNEEQSCDFLLQIIKHIIYK
ncbi:TetR family transcriptional regulator [Fervidicella metallireducens AeB]|uniref:TetR family transcriptional regulator n=1 Tax=Fervidicella metallireducens AeB TaxID=1403537 RepID=A0A017RV62_9CLOT|nr:TetR/AcrR family transcriptional regulator [Fervidicella metallireducens]EYE87805.1 TetR family transcriptional regulator [Fervidicella metallireducens AeB]